MKHFMLFLFFPWLVRGEFQMGIASGSFLGQQQIVGTWVDETKVHEWSASLGFTQDQNIGPIWQYSAIYLMSFLEVRPFGLKDTLWKPFLAGGFITYTDNTYFYFNSPNQYPHDRYYDVTSVRGGLRLSTQVQNIQIFERAYIFSFDGSLIDRAFNNYYNNPTDPDILKHYWSLGLSLKTLF